MKGKNVLAIGGLVSAVLGFALDAASFPHALGVATGVMIVANVVAILVPR